MPDIAKNLAEAIAQGRKVRPSVEEKVKKAQEKNDRLVAQWIQEAKTLADPVIEGLEALAKLPGSQMKYECTYFDGYSALWATIKTNVIGKKGFRIEATIGSSRYDSTPWIYYDMDNRGIFRSVQTKDSEKVLQHIARSAAAQGLIP